MELYRHQRRFLLINPNKALLLWEAGSGKNFTAVLWLKKRPERKTLIVAPKSVQEKWKKDLKENGVVADITTTDGIKKLKMSQYKTLVIDECHNIASPIFIKGRSARVTVIYNYVRENPDAHILLLSATPIRSQSWNAHTLGTFIGQYVDWKKWQKDYYYLSDIFGRWHYEAKKDWRKQVRPYIEKISDIVLMRDIVEVPMHSEEVVKIPWTKEDEATISLEYMEPSAQWHDRHRKESGKKKFDNLQEILSQYRKVVVVCYYLEQIESYKKWIGNDREVFVMTGATKNQGEVVRQAQESDDCVFLIQSNLGVGFDLDSFSVMVFCSLSFSYISLVQMKARINRIHNLHPNKYIYLLAGKADEAVWDQLRKGEDFDVIKYLANVRRV